MISFIIPAYNEEEWIGGCISAIRKVMLSIGEPYELIVVNDASTDRTASIAMEGGARIVQVACRHISATRNAGAREAKGDRLFFVDADTQVNEQTVRSALQAFRNGVVGGGCVPSFDGKLPFWWRISYPFTVLAIRLLRQPGGSCLFCTRAAFEATGGFSETHYAAEDALFASALKRVGPFAIADGAVRTSGRTLRTHSFWSIARLLTRLAVHGPDGFRDRKGLELWYQPTRTKKR